MAEGWAHQWIQNRKEILGEQLNRAYIENIGSDVESKLSKIENTVVASVALDSSSVFLNDQNQMECQNLDMSKHNQIDPMTSHQEQQQQKQQKHASSSFYSSEPDALSSHCRKLVKAKAVEAMADGGVDISAHFPKTLDEILPIIHQNNSVVATTTTTSQNGTNKPSSHHNYEIDKLIVLCSCGDDIKQKLTTFSKSVEEWMIDPPTTAAKSGEGDKAYRRVSLEIRDEVNTLMECLLA
jgi:protein-tyrosine-phosphatase